jgi:hypothetical protein
MDKKIIKQLAVASFTNNILDENKVNRIIKYLTRGDLKNYIKALRLIQKSQTVTVFIPNQSYNLIVNDIKKMYPNKTIVTQIDKSLIAGVKIINNDEVFESNIKNNINNLVNYISQ